MAEAELPLKYEKVALVTGGAQRLGAGITRALHKNGFQVIIHYRQSASLALELAEELNHHQSNSTTTLKADLTKQTDIHQLAQEVLSWKGKVNVLVNNASSFYPTPFGDITESQWENLSGSNLKGPFFLSQALASTLRENRGCIVNMADIHARWPLIHYSAYCIAKAGVAMMTKALAQELSPLVRVNGVAPGVILWAKDEMDTLNESNKQVTLKNTALGRQGSVEEIAQTVLFLCQSAHYITGQMITVDGGRSLYLY